MRLSVVLAFSLLISACSAYQSEGRKYLESNAFEFAGVSAQAHLTGCRFARDGAEWTFLHETPEAEVFAREAGGTYQLYVSAKAAETPAFGCEYAFESADQRLEISEDAVDLTLQHYVSLLKPSVSNP